MRKTVYSLMAVTIALLGTSLFGGQSWALTQTLVSGDGAIGTRDANNEFTLDGGANFQDAYIVQKHPAYANPIPGTNFISRVSSVGISLPKEIVRFRTTFELDCFINPSLTVLIHADNWGEIFLNGVSIGSQPKAEIFPNFQGSPESFTTTDAGLFLAGTNILEFDLGNFSGPAAFDYEATVTVAVNDADDDGVCDDEDLCLGTIIPEATVPSKGELNPNHWALLDDDENFDTVTKGRGKGAGRSYTIEDTAGCSCEQIIEELDLGNGHVKHGCSNSAMDDWVSSLNP